MRVAMQGSTQAGIRKKSRVKKILLLYNFSNNIQIIMIKRKILWQIKRT